MFPVVTGAATPVPETLRARGLAFVLLKSLMVPVCWPIAFGTKTTCMFAEPPGWSVRGTFWPFRSDAKNCGDSTIELIVSAAPPVLTREKTNGALAVSTVWGLKLKLKGEDDSTPLLVVT
jgi:hypothetical protein